MNVEAKKTRSCVYNYLQINVSYNTDTLHLLQDFLFFLLFSFSAKMQEVLLESTCIMQIVNEENETCLVRN